MKGHFLKVEKLYSFISMKIYKEDGLVDVMFSIAKHPMSESMDNLESRIKDVLEGLKIKELWSTGKVDEETPIQSYYEVIIQLSAFRKSEDEERA